MFDITKGFIRNDADELMEGLLYDVPTESVHVLFVLREPDCENEQSFWLRNTLHGKTGRGKNGNKILNTFTKLACFALGKEDADILKECAFINLYPYDGKPRVEKDCGFIQTLNEIRNPAGKTVKYGKREIDITKLAANRIKLFKHLSDTNIRHIITVADIFNCIASDDACDSAVRIHKKNGQQFRIGSLIYDNRISVYEYYHPSARCVNYKLLDDAIARRII